MTWILLNIVRLYVIYSSISEKCLDFVFEKAEKQIVVGGVDFSSHDMLTDEKSIFHVKVKNITMCRCVDFIHAFAVMITLHYVFNVTYSNKTEATMVFIQRLFFNINDNQKITPKVLSLICRVKKGQWKKKQTFITRDWMQFKSIERQIVTPSLFCLIVLYCFIFSIKCIPGNCLWGGYSLVCQTCYFV